MAKRGPHGTLRQGPPSPKDGASESGTTPEPRQEEYVDQAVQTFRSAGASTLKNEKKIVIPSREARTLKVKHSEVPALAAAIARQRARGKGSSEDAPPAAENSAPAGDTSWVDERDSFDPETFSAEHDGSPEPATKNAAGHSRGGLLFLLLAMAAGGGGFLLYRNQTRDVAGDASPKPAASLRAKPASATASPSLAESADTRAASASATATSAASNPPSGEASVSPPGSPPASDSENADGAQVRPDQ